MKGQSLAWVLSVALAGVVLGGTARAEERRVLIGTGGETGIYYVVGQSICRFLNQDAGEQGVGCKAPASGGGVANVRGLRSGAFDFGIMQADHQYKALKGQAPFEAEGPMADIRALFSLHDEVFTLLVRRDAGIASLDDLRGKRVNVGNPGSGQRNTLDELMRVKGWDRSVFALSAELKPAEQASALGDNNIDAMTYFVGHPNGAIQEATTITDAVLVPVSGAEVERLLAERPYYSKAEIPGGLYRGNAAAVPSIGSRAVLSTTASTDPQLVYLLVKAVFENFERFQGQHPSFAGLRAADMIEVGLSAPLHEGALRYYRERGWR
ncbi:TAXI family TRAP transporter solute-binding subunit [Pseudomonas lalucatii]|uniref:TAXI family TRAP transporter solute-binding subunit n=1 Tax=Pseudomonas lalucatii TaxID=1424203 RepID=A0ABS5Q219_9PSED|nr:TAXI family TRAP transporter solute-binding subunit [Pseudomonas lalucatii]MBS7662820.1 TAXI family TRAP transporter solute-binding subunit [Pseudomonas lalucatii]MBS7691176.1 TAXI family TRAP transporter solute-binding subunit [Pseudomonas lalucatii]MBS7725691.1 TAXI family TRAP transporter solute-binding subunit [Pseudomonas lalucatii]QVM88702.1 TAXI family TRAP transporter solute-binding subunit [Pseudomonas lalucatii]